MFLVQGKERGDMFKNLKYGVFGLGNRQYEHFNKVCTCYLFTATSELLSGTIVIDCTYVLFVLIFYLLDNRLQ